MKQAIRALAKSPGFTVVAVLTLALGIGASTTIFSVVEAVLLRALPYPRPQQLIQIREQAQDGHRMSVAWPNYEDLRSQNDCLSAVAAHTGQILTAVSGGREPVRANVAMMTGGFFRVLGVYPFIGREFTAEERRPHGTRAAVVSYAFWMRQLGAVRNLSGAELRLFGDLYPVVGVMPPGFNYPSGVAIWIAAEHDPDTSTRTAHNWRVVGRVRNGLSIDAARANLSGIAHRIRAAYGEKADLTDVAVIPLAEYLVGDVRTALLTLAAAVGSMLLIACANVAGLLLSRMSARRKELAVRIALGAGKRRVFQQFLTESIALSFLAGVLGTLSAIASIRALPAILPEDLPRQVDIGVNLTVLLFAVAVTAAIALALGLFGAWRASKGDVQEALTSTSRGATASRDTHRFRGFIVSGEIAITMIILIGAGLLGRSFLRLIETAPGFRQAGLITVQSSFNQSPDSTLATNAYLKIQSIESVLARLRQAPGVESLGLSGAIPAAGGDNLADGTFLILNGRKPPASFAEWDLLGKDPALSGRASYAVASEGYFRTLEIPVLRGRSFRESDTLNAPHVAVISQALARQRWPKQDPIGQEIEFGNMDGNLKPMTIVGVVGDVRALGLDAPPAEIIYVNYRQRGLNINSSPTIFLRSSAPLATVASAAERAFRDAAPDMPVRVSSFADEMGGWLADRRFLLMLVSAFAVIALLLAAVGTYGLIAFSVARRTQEIGIRMALGAQNGDVLRLILSEGLRLAAVGVTAGVAGSVAITQSLARLLFGVSPTDPLTFAAVAALLTTVALTASLLPAWRAMRFHPMKALRYE